MIFIGIVTDSKSENNITELLKNNNSLNENNVIFIKEKNIDNIKNVHFDTVVINKEFEKMDKAVVCGISLGKTILRAEVAAVVAISKVINK